MPPSGFSGRFGSRPWTHRASAIEPWMVRSLDAMHLEAAVGLAARGSIAAVLTYDRQLQAGCAHHGLVVHAPEAA